MYRVSMAMHRRWQSGWNEAGQGSRRGRFLRGETLAKLCQRLLCGIFLLARRSALALWRASLYASLTTGAFAAERPVREPPAYAGICFASGFFYLPDSRGCLRIAGPASGKTGEPDSPPDIPGSLVSMAPAASVHRDCADIFPASAQSGVPCGKNEGFRLGNGSKPTCGIAFFNNPFFQFPGLTAGRAAFISGPDSDSCIDLSTEGPSVPVPLLAYTATFGDGFSPVLSLETRLLRGEKAGSRIATAEAAPSVSGKGTESYFLDAGPGAQTSGITGNLRLDPAWGTVRVPVVTDGQQAGFSQPGALAAIAPFPPPAGFTPPKAFPSFGSRPYGFAMRGGAPTDLDYLPVADKLWLEAAYDKGGMSDAEDRSFTNAHGPARQPRAMESRFGADSYYPGWNPQINSGCVLAGSGKCEQQWGWDITGADKNYWLPILNSTIFGSSLEIRHQAGTAGSSESVTRGAAHSEAPIAPPLFNSPLEAFDIGAEYMYAHLSQTRPISPGLGPDATAGGLPAFGPNTELYDGHLRVQSGY
jgi:hypothetical protein